MKTQVPFVFDLDGKSLDVTVQDIPLDGLEKGDLVIRGVGANYQLDREDELFEGPNTFSHAVKTFLSGNAPLCYAHKTDQVVGRVLSAVPGEDGVQVTAVVDYQPEGSPLRHIYEGVRRKRINGFSCAGIFKRRIGAKGHPVIHDVDLTEWSVAPIVIGRGTSFEVIAQKALDMKAPEGEAKTDDSREGVGSDEQKNGREATLAEPEPKPTEEEVIEEAVEEKIEGLMVTADGKISGTITASMIEAGTITSTLIEAGAITTEHLSDDLRSHFQELAPEQPEINELSEALDRLESSLTRVADEVGITINEPSEDAVTT